MPPLSPSPLPQTLGSFLVYFLRPFWKVGILFILLAVMAGAWGPFNGFFMKSLVDSFSPAPQNFYWQGPFWPCAFIALNFLIFDNLTWRGMAYLRYRHLPAILNTIDSALLNSLLHHSPPFFQDRPTGSLSKQIFHLIDGVEKIIVSAPILIRAFAQVIFAIWITAETHPLFSLIVLGWSFLFLLISLRMSKKLSSLSRDQAAQESILGGQIIDSLSNHKTVTLFSGHSYEVDRRQPFLESYLHAYRAKDRYQLYLHGMQGLLIASMLMGTTGVLMSLHTHHQLSPGDFVLIIGVLMDMGHTLWFTMGIVDDMNKAIGRCQQGLQVLSIPFDVTNSPQALPLVTQKGKIEFEQVFFGYGTESSFLKNYSLVIPGGQKVGLVGYSGSGKSTFIQLILRLYNLRSGTIYLDDQNIAHVTQQSLREAIAMIPQDPSLFDRTLMDNIRYGRRDATDEEVKDAARKAHAHDFIQKLPDGYHTLVGERGVKLSGGQRQRIAIARAILKNSPVLILDEATSQLDSVTEALIQESLWSVMEKKTTLVIAHRLSTLLHMDRILVFEGGRIVGDGCHEALFQENSLYGQLWSHQVGGFLKDPLSPSE